MRTMCTANEEIFTQNSNQTNLRNREFYDRKEASRVVVLLTDRIKFDAIQTGIVARFGHGAGNRSVIVGVVVAVIMVVIHVHVDVIVVMIVVVVVVVIHTQRTARCDVRR